MQKIFIITIILIVGVGAFYGGMKYAGGQRGQGMSSMEHFSEMPANMQNLSQERREQMRQQFDGQKMPGMRLSGQIIARDDDSVTIELSDGGSKIIFLSESTKIAKQTDSSVDDLQDGVQVFISGEENSDGSYTAESIQIGGKK